MGCRAFGLGSLDMDLDHWISPWIDTTTSCSFLLVLAGSRTAEVEGISAAGATPESRRFTAIADAELLLYGPSGDRSWPMPPLQAGVSPALISYVAASWIGLDPMVLAVGLPQTPRFPHLRIEEPSLGPAACLSTGHSMSLARVQSLWQRGFSIGKKLKRPLLLAECVPGGTTTAQAVLTGFGLSVAELISSSSLVPPVEIKQSLIKRGLQSASSQSNWHPHRLLAAIGDPFQPVAAGIVLGARQAGQPVLLGGGSQMVAVIALALAALDPDSRLNFVAGIALATTAWLVDETSNSSKESGSLESLMNLVGNHFGVPLMGFATGLHFDESKHQALRDYELGYVKEGVGAGALAFLAQLHGASCNQLVGACDIAMDELVMSTLSSSSSFV